MKGNQAYRSLDKIVCFLTDIKLEKCLQIQNVKIEKKREGREHQNLLSVTLGGPSRGIYSTTRKPHKFSLLSLVELDLSKLDSLIGIPMILMKGAHNELCRYGFSVVVEFVGVL